MKHLFLTLNRSPLSRAWVSVWGAQVRSRSFDRLAYLWLNKLGMMGADSRRLMERMIQPGATVVDVGANIGLYSSLCSRLVGPSGKVIAIEPEENNIHAIREMIERNALANIEFHTVAASEKAESLAFEADAFNSGNHSVVSADGSKSVVSAIEAKTLDEIVAGRRVHFIKIDVQGWEMQVLRGAEKTLATNRPLHVLMEVWPAGLKRNGITPEELIGFLKNRGFSIDMLGREPDADSNSELDFYDVLATANP